MSNRGRLINAAASASARVVDAESALARVPKNAMHRIAERLQLEGRVAAAKAELGQARADLAVGRSVSASLDALLTAMREYLSEASWERSDCPNSGQEMWRNPSHAYPVKHSLREAVNYQRIEDEVDLELANEAAE